MEKMPMPNNPEKTKLEQKEDFIRLNTGDKVKVLRTNGEVDEDWEIYAWNEHTGAAKIRKVLEDGKPYTKEIPRMELYALNVKKGDTLKFPYEEWKNFYNEIGLHSSSAIRKRMASEEYRFHNEGMTPEEAKSYFSGGRVTLDGSREEMDLKKKKIKAYTGSTFPA